jgi:hypothetical protein
MRVFNVSNKLYRGRGASRCLQLCLSGLVD